MSIKYVDIVLPVARGPFTFEGDVEEGRMVRVQFGKRKHMTGIVWRTHTERPPFVVKPVEEALEGRLTTEQMRFWEWLSEYYMCGLGEVMAAALPSALRPEGMSAEDFAEHTMKPRRRKTKGVFSGALPELPEELPVLSDAQQEAMEGVAANERDVVLLHGVTGSGKTEIYIRLIAEQLKRGRNVLYLLPEIAMSSQLVGRVREWFGDRVVVYNSRITPRRRAEAWERVAVGEEGIVILGVRSALLLPLRNLGLIVVDEEHDRSYKQEDPAPRYGARDAAIVLAQIMGGVRTILGSATPSLESFHNAQRGKYGYVYLGERYGGSELPRVVVSDTLKAVERGERTVHFNKVMLDKLHETLEEGRQAMLFQNRRGFAPYVECAECGAAVMCRQCNVAMTWHKDSGVLRCHYCGRSVRVPSVCPTCGAASLEPRGFGTQKVEQELETLFPEARIERLDRDVAGHEGIIERFAAGETDVLVGTQMITKGFDFGGVGLVGVLNADNLLAYPDFRAAERAYQTLTQMSGRGGRRGERAEVVIQTVRPNEPLIRQVAEGDYFSMARDQLAERREFLYPPFCRLVTIRLYGRSQQGLWAAANDLATRGRSLFGNMLLGPQPALVDKVKGEHILTLLLKITDPTARRKLTALLAAFVPEKGIRISCDVDPQ